MAALYVTRVDGVEAHCGICLERSPLYSYERHPAETARQLAEDWMRRHHCGDPEAN